MQWGKVTHLVVDESHSSVSPAFFAVIEYFKKSNPDIKILGLTATPIRTDHDGLVKVFETVAYKFTINKAIAAGALCPFNALGFSLPVDFSNVKETEDGYDDEATGELLAAENVIEIVYEKWKEYASDRQTIGFTASVFQAVKTAEYFREQGVSAEYVSGMTPRDERRKIIDAFRAGEIQVLCNCQVLVLGFDSPEIAAVLMVAPTKSDLQYIQKMGRGLRLAPGKKDALILDFAPIGARSVVMAGDILGKPRDVQKAEKKAERSGVLFAFNLNDMGETTEVDPAELVIQILDLLSHHYLAWYVDEHKAVAGVGERTAMLVELPDLKRVEKANELKSAGQWNPNWDIEYSKVSGYTLWTVENNYAQILGIFETMESAQTEADNWAEERYEAIIGQKKKAWRREPATPKQLQLLSRLKVDVPSGCSKGHAAQLITASIAWSAVKRVK
jgi:superfamily II DNA or RNA helicase